MKKITLLGSTGSIGTQTLDVIRQNRDKFEVVAISANRSVDLILEQILEFKPKYAVLYERESAEKLKTMIPKDIEIEILDSIDGLEKISTLDEVDIVLTALVGMIGLIPTMKAIEHKKDIALANKETLVTAGEIVMKAAEENGVKILPVDSEHSAIFQCLNGENKKQVNKLILTASGGPFRGKNLEDLKDVTVKEALKHPKWNMGQKISIDSATLMNKGLEVIEAHYLFECSYDNIEVVVHPQSIIHSMVEYKDASVIAQMGSPDMRLPIQYALNYPKREGRIANPISFYEIAQLTFEKPDMDTFKCLKLAFKAGKAGGLMPTILNGANEEAVALLLEEKIKFLDIADLIEECMDKFKDKSNMELTIDNIIAVDQEVREYLRKKVS